MEEEEAFSLADEFRNFVFTLLYPLDIKKEKNHANTLLVGIRGNFFQLVKRYVWRGITRFGTFTNSKPEVE